MFVSRRNFEKSFVHLFLPELAIFSFSLSVFSYSNVLFGSFLLSSYYLVFFCVTVLHSLCVGLSFCFFTFIFAYLHSYFQLYCHTCHHALFFRILSNISVLLFGYLSKHEIQRAIFDFGCTRWICLRAFSPWAPSLYLSFSLSLSLSLSVSVSLSRKHDVDTNKMY